MNGLTRLQKVAKYMKKRKEIDTILSLGRVRSWIDARVVRKANVRKTLGIFLRRLPFFLSENSHLQQQTHVVLSSQRRYVEVESVDCEEVRSMETEDGRKETLRREKKIEKRRQREKKLKRILAFCLFRFL